jgi:hypothetical protein
VTEVFSRKDALERQSGEANQRLLLGPIAVGKRRHGEASSQPLEPGGGIGPWRQALPCERQLIARR